VVGQGDTAQSGGPPGHLTVSAEVVTRFVFNFRVEPAVARALLPDALEPEIVDGSAVYSYCPYVLGNLRVDRRRVGKRPTTICAAGRITATDRGGRVAWVPARQTNSRSVALGAPFVIGTERFDVVRAAVRTGPLGVVAIGRGSTRFEAIVAVASAAASTLFSSTDDFVSFFTCESALSPGRAAPDFVRIDLDATGTRFMPLAVEGIVAMEAPAGAEFDSGFAGVGGQYRWRKVDNANTHAA
jgi:hypothetical protein